MTQEKEILAVIIMTVGNGIIPLSEAESVSFAVTEVTLRLNNINLI